MKDAAEVFDCPHCGKPTKIPQRLLGKKVRCPGCKEIFLAGGEPELDVLEEVKDDDYDVREAPRVKKRRYVDDDDDRPRKRRGKRESTSGSSNTPSFQIDVRKLGFGVFGVIFGLGIVVVGSASGNRGGAYGAGQSAAFGMGLLFLLAGIGTVIGAFYRRY